jgi:hypothetical protein
MHYAWQAGIRFFRVSFSIRRAVFQAGDGAAWPPSCPVVARRAKSEAWKARGDNWMLICLRRKSIFLSVLQRNGGSATFSFESSKKPADLRLSAYCSIQLWASSPFPQAQRSSSETLTASCPSFTGSSELSAISRRAGTPIDTTSGKP